MPTVTSERVERVAADVGGPPGFPPPINGGGGGGDGHPARDPGLYRTGIWVALAPIVMMFTAFASAYIVRRGLSNDWRALDLPGILWLNTAFLIAGSLAMEKARGGLRRGDGLTFTRWWSVTTALGIAFLGGQLLAWMQLAARGVYLSSNPSSSFFYVLTAAHGLHLLGGELALGYVAYRVARPGARVFPRSAVDATAIYWHFLGVLWVSLFLLLLLWR